VAGSLCGVSAGAATRACLRLAASLRELRNYGIGMARSVSDLPALEQSASNAVLSDAVVGARHPGPHLSRLLSRVRRPTRRGPPRSAVRIVLGGHAAAASPALRPLRDPARCPGTGRGWSGRLLGLPGRPTPFCSRARGGHLRGVSAHGAARPQVPWAARAGASTRAADTRAMRVRLRPGGGGARAGSPGPGAPSRTRIQPSRADRRSPGDLARRSSATAMAGPSPRHGAPDRPDRRGATSERPRGIRGEHVSGGAPCRPRRRCFDDRRHRSRMRPRTASGRRAASRRRHRGARPVTAVQRVSWSRVYPRHRCRRARCLAARNGL
jgi:hypothetical protein